MISASTRSTVKGYLEGFVEGLIESKRAASRVAPRDLRPPRATAPKGDYRPFHESILPEGILRTSEFERSFSTKLGTTFEEVARLLAIERWPVVERSFKVSGIVSRSAVRTIERICNRINSDGMHKPWHELVAEVLAKTDNTGSQRKRIADLYLADADGNELFFEVKSPKPNKDQCLRITEKLLHIHAIPGKGPPHIRTFLAMPYNPYGEARKGYNHSFAMSYLDMENQVLVGKEFWDLIAGRGSYAQLLEIFREVGREKGPDMIEQLALGY